MRVKSMNNRLRKSRNLLVVSAGTLILMVFCVLLFEMISSDYMIANSIVQTVLFCCLIFAASVWDVCRRTIPDVICLSILLTGFVDFNAYNAFGVLLGLPLLIAALVKEGGMGGGDIKLTAASGFVLGLPSGFAGLILALMSVLFYYLCLKIICIPRQKKLYAAKEATIPMAPFLCVGFILAAIFN